MPVVRIAFASALVATLAGIVACSTRPSEPRGTEARENVADRNGAPLLAIFSAFPAEMAPLLAEASIDSTVEINGRTFSIGTLRGVHVAMGLTGIGLANASATAEAALGSLPVDGVVFSGVAGGPFRIGDVAAPATWSLDASDAGTFAADPSWLSIASSLMGAPCYEHCTVVQWTGEHVCLDYTPGLTVGGEGQSREAKSTGDCDPNGNDVFGCDVGTPQGESESCQGGGTTSAQADAGSPTIVDNETGAVAAAAQKHHLRFIAFRSQSDGAGDPLGLPGFPAEFFAYYRLAARNAARTTLAFLERVGRQVR
jgi:nucleoside phosphorylase